MLSENKSRFLLSVSLSKGFLVLLIPRNNETTMVRPVLARGGQRRKKG